MKKNVALLIVSLTLLTACNSNTETESHKEDNHPEETATAAAHAITKSDDNDTEKRAQQQKDISVDNILIRASFAGQNVASAFFTMHNNGDKDLEIKTISSNVSDATEFHTMEIKDSTMVMRQMDKVIIPSQETLVLSSGADHVMLLNLKESLLVDKEVILTIRFTDGSMQEIKGLAQDAESVNERNTDDNAEMNHEHMDHSEMNHN